MTVMLECDNGKVGELTLKYNCEMEKMNGLIQASSFCLHLSESNIPSSFHRFIRHHLRLPMYNYRQNYFCLG